VAAVGVARGDDLGDEVAHLQALERYQPVEVGEGDLAYEPVHGLGSLLECSLLWLRPDAAEVLLQDGLEPEVVNGGPVVPLDVGQPVEVEPAPPDKAVALELDPDVVLQFVS